MATPGLISDRDAQSVVLLVNGAGGGELTGVRDALTGALHTPTVLIANTDFASIVISLDPDSGLMNVGGRRVRPAVVWIRHGATSAMVAQARPAGSVTALNAASWSVFLRQVAASATALPGTAPVATMQLTQAGRLGVRTPRTVLTTDVGAGVRQLRTRRVIVKTPDFRLVEPDPRNWGQCLPVIVDRDTLAGDRAVAGRPVVVQEYVAHAQELRVYYLNGGICAFDVRKSGPAALWTDPGSVAVTRVDCPPAAAAAVRALSVAWNLRYGAFDLLVTHSGEVVLLEANPDGDWLWYERKARWHGVSFMAAVMVRELFARATSKGTPVDECVVG
jgi:hypothetical protein